LIVTLLDDAVVTPGRPSWSARVTTHAMTGPVVVAMAAAAALTCLAIRDPNSPGAYGHCPFKALTGWDCPGCGSLRALHALTHGDVRTALDQNVLLVMAVPFLVWRWITWTRRSAIRARTGEAPAGRLAPPWVLWTVLAVVLAFWVVRNLPGVPFLGSGIG
jgi:hypothetical protein